MALIGGLTILAILAINPAFAQESAADFFRKDREYYSKGLKAPEVEKYDTISYAETKKFVSDERNAVAQAVAQTTTYKIGSEWVETALHITKVESGFRCSAVGPRVRGGRARGAMQVMPGTALALGYAPSELTTCSVGINAGVDHMRKCIDSGVKTPSQMAACHVAGVQGWKTHLRKRSERYKKQYVRMVMSRM